MPIAVDARRRPALERGCPPAVESAGYFVLSEALANAVKHAQADELTVSLGARRRRAARSRSPTTASAARRAPAAPGMRGDGRPRRGARRPAAVDERRPARGTRVARGAAMRVVIGEDQALMREGLALAARAGGLRDRRRSPPTREDARPQGARPPARPRRHRHPHAADPHRRRAAGGARDPRASCPDLPVLVLSQHVQRRYAAELLESGDGGVGYLLKQRVADVDAFGADLRRVVAGGTVLDPEVVARDDRPRRATTTRSRGLTAAPARGARR